MKFYGNVVNGTCRYCGVKHAHAAPCAVAPVTITRDGVTVTVEAPQRQAYTKWRRRQERQFVKQVKGAAEHMQKTDPGRLVKVIRSGHER